jgi:DNA-binding transcriptional LysR family regulator
VAAARHLSFTRAAAELFLTQSAISRQIQTLEQALGVALFQRGTRSLALTEAGARLFREAEGWLADYAALARRLRQARGRQPVTVTATIGIATLWLVPRLTRFQARHPDIDVRLAAGNRIMDLAREGIDLAIRYCADRDAPAGAERLFGETVVPVASPAVGARPLARESLPETVLLEFDDPRYPWLGWDPWLAAVGLEGQAPRARVAYTHYDQLIQAAVAGQGIALGRTWLTDGLVAEGRLVVVGAARREVDGWGFWLVAAPGEMRPEVARFADWVRAESALTGPGRGP